MTNESKQETAVPARSTTMTKDAVSSSPKPKSTEIAENKEPSRSNADPVTMKLASLYQVQINST